MSLFKSYLIDLFFIYIYIYIYIYDGTDEPFFLDKLIKHLCPHLHVTDKWRKVIQCSK